MPTTGTGSWPVKAPGNSSSSATARSGRHGPADERPRSPCPRPLGRIQAVPGPADLLRSRQRSCSPQHERALGICRERGHGSRPPSHRFGTVRVRGGSGEGRCNGYCCDPFDPGCLERLLLRVASAGCDREGLGRASSEMIAAWAPDRFASGLRGSSARVGSFGSGRHHRPVYRSISARTAQRVMTP